MALLRRLLFTRVGPNLSAAAVIQPALAVVGVFTFVAGGLYLPSPRPTVVEAVMILLLLAAVALLCTAVGQLSAVLERLDARADRPAAPDAAPERRGA